MVHQAAVRRVTGREELSDAVRYAAHRWAELLDPATHFSRAACSYIDPMTGLLQFEDLLADFATGHGSRWPEVVEWMRMLREIVKLDPNVGSWAGTERNALDQALNNAVSSVPNSAPPWQKENVVRARVAQLQATELPAFHGVLLGASGDLYRQNLVQRVRGWLGGSVQDADWPRFDRDLAYLASRLLAEGRDGGDLIEELLVGWEDAEDTVAALAAFGALVARPMHVFTVAVPLVGVRRLRRVSPFGATVLSDRSRWPGRNPPDPGGLREFVKRHRDGLPRAACVLVEVTAHDHAGALVAAHERAEAIADHIVAEHRLNDVDIGSEALVRCTSTGKIKTMPAAQPPVGEARLFTGAPVADLSGSLRLNRLARQAHAPVLSVSLHWVAMEGAANGAPKEAGTFVPPHASAMMALAAAKYQLTSTWTHLREHGRAVGDPRWQQLESWLNVTGNQKHVDLVRWIDLLCLVRDTGTVPTTLALNDPDVVAARMLRDVAAAFGPFHLRRLFEISDRLNNAGQLSNWLVAQNTHARLNLQRIRFMRHRALHRADLSQERAIALRQAARDLTDGLYEVLQAWLPGRRPWEAMRDSRKRYNDLKSQWSQEGPIRATFDPTKLTAP